MIELHYTLIEDSFLFLILTTTNQYKISNISHKNQASLSFKMDFECQPSWMEMEINRDSFQTLQIFLLNIFSSNGIVIIVLSDIIFIFLLICPLKTCKYPQHPGPEKFIWASQH